MPGWRYDYNAYWPLDVQARTLIKPVKFGADRTFYGLVTTTYSHGETSNFVTPPGTRPLAKTQDLHNLTSQRPLDDTDQYNFHVIKSLGGVRYRVKHVTSCCQQVAL